MIARCGILNNQISKRSIENFFWDMVIILKCQTDTYLIVVSKIFEFFYAHKMQKKKTDFLSLRIFRFLRDTNFTKHEIYFQMSLEG